MKTRNLLLALPLSMLFASCSFSFSGNETWEKSADTKEEAIEFYKGFFEEYFKSDTYQVEVSSEVGSRTEVVKGNKEKVTYKDEEKTEYLFVENNEYYYCIETSQSKEYGKSKDEYDKYFCSFKLNFEAYKEFDGAPDCNYLYSEKGESKNEDGKITSQCVASLTITTAKDNFVVLLAMQNNLLRSFSITYSEVGGDGEPVRIVIGINYENVDVTIPDLSDWTERGK